MTRETRIRTLSDAEDTDLRSLRVQFGNSEVITPTKAVISTSFYKDTAFPKNLSNVHQMFVRLNKDSVIKIDQDNSYSRKKNLDLSRLKERAGNIPSLTITEFKNRGEGVRYPEQDEIRTLTNLAYTYSDITPIPSIPKVARSLDRKNFPTFLSYLDACYESIEERNKKCIMGYIPALAASFGRELINFYLDRGINSYYIDFDGSMVKSRLDTLNAMKIELNKRGYEENHFFHFINASYGKSINDQMVLSARDLLGFGYGLDSLGGVHMGPKGSKEFYEMLKKSKDLPRNTKRLLDIEDYGYYRLDTIENNLHEHYPDNPLIRQDDITTGNDSRIDRSLKTLNLHQQCVESNNLIQLVNENSEKTLDYYRTKRNILAVDLKGLERG